MMAGPLQGTRVLDLTNVLSGPFAAHQLAHFGAEVIKIEMPGRGDLARQLGSDAELNKRQMGISFLAQNAGKKSVTINLKSGSGKDVLCDLVRGADVLIENFRPGVMDRLGLGFSDLRKINEGLIYCAVSGFGQTGPWKDRPAYDQIVQGASGIMSVTGQPGEGPMRTGFPISDTVGGLTAAMAICAALCVPRRGAFIDVSLLDATLATMAWVLSNYQIGGDAPKQHGNENPTSAPSGMFATADGHINIAANRDEQWEALAHLIDRADLLEAANFQTREDRKRNRDALRGEIEKALTKAGSAEWVDRLNANGIPAGMVLSVPEILAHPQIASRGFMQSVTAPDIGEIEVVTTGAQIDGAPTMVKDGPPTLGQHTDMVLKGLGYSAGRIAALRKEGAI